MRKTLFCLVFGLFGVLACGENSDPFLPFPKLCPVYAEQVCSARELCCMLPEQVDDCELRIETSCDAQREQLSQENGLQYKGDHAQEVSGLQQGELDACKAPYDLSRFFSNGAKDGAFCERASQCAKGACVDGHCAAAASVPLCEP